MLNPEQEVLTIHTLQGVVFFLIGFSLLYAVDNVLMRYLPKDSGEHGNTFLVPGKDELAGKKQGRLSVLASLFAVLFVVSLIMPKWSTPTSHAYTAISLPDDLGEWKHTDDLPVRYSFLGSVRYSSTLYRGYTRNNEPVSLFIGTDDRLQRHRSLLSDKSGYPEGVGLEQERSIVDLGPDIGSGVSIVIDDVDGQRWLTYNWYEGVDSVAKEIVYALLALDQSPLRRDKQARVTRLTTYVELTPEGRMRADKRLRAFLEEMEKSDH